MATNSITEIMEGINKRVSEGLGHIWKANARQNMHEFKNFKRLRALEFFPNKIAMVCGAGPSLMDEKHIEFMKKYRDFLSIFSVDTALPVLYKQGIFPDYTVNIDAANIAECFLFKKLPQSCKLLAANVSHPNTIRAWPNRHEIYTFNLFSAHPINQELCALTPKQDPVDSKLNVGEFCVNLAIKYFNYKMVIFTGMDFAYVGDRDYAEGVAHRIERDAEEYIMLDCFDQPVKVSPSFIGFTIAFMTSYRVLYSKKAALISLNKGMLPLKYEYEKAENLLSRIAAVKEKYEQQSENN